MEEQTDSTFIKNISIVLGVLIAVTIIIAFVARDIGFQEPPETPGSEALTEARIQSVAGVYTSENAPDPAAAAAAQAATAAPAAAFDGSLDAEMIYNSVCGACHTAGVAGAPIPGSPEMAQRAEKGLDALIDTALNGLNAMPARGGRADLSDEQVKVAVEFMLK